VSYAGITKRSTEAWHIHVRWPDRKRAYAFTHNPWGVERHVVVVGKMTLTGLGAMPCGGTSRCSRFGDCAVIYTSDAQLNWAATNWHVGSSANCRSCGR